MLVKAFIIFDLTYFREIGQKYRNIFVCFLVQMKTSKSHSKIKWPLVWISKNTNQILFSCQIVNLIYSFIYWLYLIFQIWGSNSLVCSRRFQILVWKSWDFEWKYPWFSVVAVQSNATFWRKNSRSKFWGWGTYNMTKRRFSTDPLPPLLVHVVIEWPLKSKAETF